MTMLRDLLEIQWLWERRSRLCNDLPESRVPLRVEPWANRTLSLNHRLLVLAFLQELFR